MLVAAAGAALNMSVVGAASAAASGPLWSTNLNAAASSLATSAGAVAWGANGLGELGNGTTVGSQVPLQVSGLGQVGALAAGTSDSLALLSGGSLLAWGGNLEGRLGTGTASGPEQCGEAPCSALPVAVHGLSEVTAVAGGGEFSLALRKDGTVMAWGSNQFGQLGDGKTESSAVPVKVSGLSGVTAIAAGLHHGLALLQNGTVVAWGENSYGELGDGTFSGPETCGEASCSTVPVAVSGLSEVTAIAAGGEFSLALHSNGTVMAWGDNQFGELGITGTQSQDLPMPVFKLGEVSAIAAGDSFSLALLKQGTVMSWGNNTYGELGDGLTGHFDDVPVPVSNVKEVTAIAAGADSGLALLQGGKVMAWGGNQFGQLGNGSAEAAEVPVPVSNLSQVSAIAASGYHTLAEGVLSTLPTVAGVLPSSGPARGGTSVTITGTNLTGATAVKFGSANARSFTVNSETSITAVSPPGTGTVDVTVSTPSGTSAKGAADHFGYGPTVTNLAPSSGPLGGGATVTITGTSLAGATAVKFGSANAHSFTVNSETSITAVSPPGTGTVAVTVTTPNGTSPAQAADNFTFAPAPAVTTVEPSSGPEAGGTSVTITGTDLTGATAVKFGSAEATSFTVSSATSIMAISPAGRGTVDVTVSTPSGTSPTSRADQFSFVQAPAVTKIEPSSGPAAGGTSVTITGSRLGGAKEVKFGSISATSFTVNSSTSVTAVSPPGSGTVDVTVAAARGYTTETTPGDRFSYGPTVTGVTPTSGPEAGGTSVTIAGTDLAGATSVKFGSRDASSFTVRSSTSIVAVSPADTGTVDVTVSTPSGTSPTGSADRFTFVQAPTVTKIEPSSGPAAGGTQVTINGTNFTGATAVKFGSANATSFTVSSASSIVAVSPAGAGRVDVTVITPRGASATATADRFSYAPTVTKLEPQTTGPVAGGNQVTITGTGFTDATAVRFGGRNAAGFTVNSDTSITTISPPDEHRVDVTVSTASGTSPTSPADQFTYTAPWEHPLLNVNTEKASNGAKVPFIGWGGIVLSNRAIGTLRCSALLFGIAMNETEAAGAPERAYGEVLSWSTTGSTNPNGEEPSARCKSSTWAEAWATAEPPPHLTTAVATVNGTERRVVEGRLGGTASHRASPSLPWRQESFGEQNAESERRFFLRTGIARTERSEVEAEEAAVGVPTERRSGCYRTPPFTEIVREPGFASTRETELAQRPAPKGCISVNVVAPEAGVELVFQGTLEPELIEGHANGLTPARWEFKGGFVGSGTELPSERSSERNERSLSSVFGPGYARSQIPIKVWGYREEELLNIR